MVAEKKPFCIRVASAVILTSQRGRRLLFVGQRQDNGMWECPGGKIERGEAPHVTIVREVKEEIGIDVVALRKPLAVHNVPLIGSTTGKTVDVYYMACQPVPAKQTVKIAEREIRAVTWVDYAGLQALERTGGMHSFDEAFRLLLLP